MSDRNGPPSKREMRLEMDAGLARLLNAIDQFSEAQMLAPQDAKGWNVRDHLTHLAAWADGIAALLRREDRWATMGLSLDASEYTNLDFDRINDKIARQNRQVSPEEARTWLIAAHERVRMALEDLSDAELVLPYERFTSPFTGDDGGPIFEYIRNNTSHHYSDHLLWMKAIVRSDSTQK